MLGAGPVAFRSLQLPQDVNGKVYLHSMPGRCEDWARFEAAATRSGIQGIVCLADEAEIAEKSASYAKALAAKLPYPVYRFPITDYGVPSDDQGFDAFVESVAERVRDGDCLLVHCGAGVGRTGMFACCLLLALGQSSDDAHAAVQASCSHPETSAQRAWVRRFALRCNR